MKSLAIPLPCRRSTLHLAQRMAQILKPCDLLVLSGGLGAGKTFFVRGMARALGWPSEEPVTSPTFALIQELETEPPLLHADLYRLDSPDQTLDLGLRDARDQGSIVVAEWAEPFIDILGGDALVMTLTLEPRVARIHSTGEESTKRLVSLSALLPLPARGAHQQKQ